MTARQNIDASHAGLRRYSVIVVIGLASGAAIAAALHENMWAMGLIICVVVSGLFMSFIIAPILYVCPGCGKRLSPLSSYSSGLNDSAFRLPKEVRFCPCCGLDFDKDLLRA
jgi:hypothetical protein